MTGCSDPAKFVFCNANGATVSNTLPLEKYAALTGQALANAQDERKLRDGEIDSEPKEGGDKNSSEGNKAAQKVCIAARSLQESLLTFLAILS